MKPVVPVLFASAFLVTSAYAQSPSPSAEARPSHAAMMKPEAKHGMEIEKHIKDLHAKLKITPAEESQWATVAQTMRDNASELDKAIENRESAAKNASAVDDLNAYGAIVQTHADAIKKLASAFSSLYAAMPDEQKKLADEVFAQRMNGGKRMAAK